MKNDAQNPFRFRRVKWGDSRHAMNALRNKEPVFADDPSGSPLLFWTLVVALVASIFVSILLIGGRHDLIDLTWLPRL